ncbi:MAG: hypothetical protein ACD_16C00167G0004 [uncultured bacterium]|nr:MAG: hypothetical protein ACD_16C00167G0004 [uncultured bacterium]OFW92714.1 MAG: hypothetical protein A2W46_01185 [Alphaproteobacteria bacterium RIFCSPHIGHO2_12_42_13]OFX04441.1 MAG: hypothetical protein A3H46_03250 [Alphaproteobacteria bacterium RIFCSPLOWO2_02_FULL_43_54]OFX07482.1 MAG: hypothetical protein A3G78_05905 [Alphaproteobacteria bacterium RIFCSPLOWO2_12_FULL_42_29]HBG34142.1 hypothetical protein [Holosporales bacterium]
MEQTLNQRNSPRNMSGTFSLKALANKILEQNKKWNKPGTDASKSVPHPDQNVPLHGTTSETDCSDQTDDLSYAFEERAAIAEVDGCQNSMQAQRIAYLDSFISLLSALADHDPHQDWLLQKIQTALASLEAQNFPTLN